MGIRHVASDHASRNGHWQKRVSGLIAVEDRRDDFGIDKILLRNGHGDERRPARISHSASTMPLPPGCSGLLG